MSDISNQLIKDSYNYVLQSDLTTGIVYRIGGSIPTNPIFLSGLTINSGFTFSNGTEQNGYVLTCDPFGNAKWAPVSGATPTSGVTSITTGVGLSGDSTTGAVTIINTAPDQTVTITGGTNIQINGTYPNFGIDFTGTTGGGDYLPLSGGTVTGGTIFQSGLTANTISATTYYNLPVTADTFVTGFSITNDVLTLTQNRVDSYSAFSVSLSAYTGEGLNYFVSATTPTGTSLVSGDRWFNTTTGIELVWIDDGDSQQWVQPFSVPGPLSPDAGYYLTTGITTSQTITWDKTYWGISGNGNVDIVLPPTISKEGYYLIIKDEAGICGTYRIRLTPTSGTIDGNNYVDMNINYMSLTCLVRGGNWYLI
jgi:hypothetical protein